MASILILSIFLHRLFSSTSTIFTQLANWGQVPIKILHGCMDQSPFTNICIVLFGENWRKKYNVTVNSSSCQIQCLNCIYMQIDCAVKGTLFVCEYEFCDVSLSCLTTSLIFQRHGSPFLLALQHRRDLSGPKYKWLQFLNWYFNDCSPNLNW